MILFPLYVVGRPAGFALNVTLINEKKEDIIA